MTQAVSLAQGGSNNVTFRNKIINGGMTVDQRGSASTPVTLNGNLFGVDRWGTQASQNSKATMQQSTTAPTGFSNSLLVTSSSAYSPTSSDYFWLYQTIEGFNTADLGWGAAGAQTITFSFWVRASVTGTYSVRVGNGSRSYVSTYTVNAANTWEQKTITVAGDTSGTWNTTNGTGIQLQFDLGCGSTRTTSTTNAWQAGDYQKATGSVSVVGTNGATFYITGVQLEAGTTATPFEQRLYGTELALCQRYYWQTQMGIYMWGNNVTNGQLYQYVPFPVVMRATPTISNNWTSSTTVQSIYASSAHGMNLQLSATVGNNFSATYNTGNTVSAEL